MRKGLFGSLLLDRSLLALGLSAMVCAVNAQERIHYLVLDERAEPFQITREGQSRGGLITEIVDAVFAGTVHSVDARVYPYMRMRKEIEQGHVPNWITYDAKAWHALHPWGEIIDVPLFETRHVLLSCKDAFPDIDRIDVMHGRQVVLMRDFDYPGLEALIDAGQLHALPTETYAAGLQLVRLGRVDGFIEMDMRLRYHRALNGFSDTCFRTIDARVLIPDYAIYLVVDRNMPDTLKAEIRARLQRLQDEGVLEALHARYRRLEAWPFQPADAHPPSPASP